MHHAPHLRLVCGIPQQQAEQRGRVESIGLRLTRPAIHLDAGRVDDHIEYAGTREGAMQQRCAILKAAEARGDTITGWYAEKKSGKTLKRPELDRLRADVRARVARRVYVFKLDRLTRSGVADTYTVIQETRTAGCTLIAVSDNLVIQPDTEDVASEVLVFALSLAARIERAAINERISAARDAVEASGGAWGRPRRMTAAQVQRARELQATGRSVRDISQLVGIPRATVHVALSRKDALKKQSVARRATKADPPPVHV